MRICFFNDISILGGGELWVLKACRHLASRGHEVMVVCPWMSPLHGRAQAEKIDVWAHHRMEGLPFYEPIYHTLKERRVDVLYCTVVGGFCEAVVLEAMVDRINRERKGSKLALVLKTGLPPMAGLGPQHYGIDAGPSVPRLHVVSEDSRQAFLKWLPELDPDFVEVVLEGTDLSQFNGSGNHRGQARARWNLDEDNAVVTCLARLHTMKGQDNLLLAIPEVVKKHPRARFLFAGEGDQIERLEKLRDHLGLGESVQFLGQVEEVPELLASSDILCHPSLADGMPNSLVEAMASGLPVVASQVGGIPEIVQHGETGLLVAPHDVKGLADSLNQLLDKPSWSREMGKSAQARIHERFNLQKNLDRLVERLQSELETVEQAYRDQPKRREKDDTRPTGVLFVMNALRTGGEETELLILSRHLDRRKFSLSALSLFEVDEPAPALAELSETGIALDTTCHHIEADGDKISYLIDKIRRERIRVVVACQDAQFAYHAMLNISPSECRMIEHGGIVPEVYSIPKDRTERYIGVSTAIREAAAERMEDSSHAVFIPSMVDVEKFEGLDRNELRRAYGIADDSCVILFVGRLDPKKRVEDLLVAGLDILPKHPTTRILVVGGHDVGHPQYMNDLMTRFSPLTDSGRVTFTGARSDVPWLLTAADILVLPSVGEGMSHVINEAGAAGLAVVAAEDGSAGEQLEGGKAGLIVPPGQPEQLREALETLIQDPDKRRDLGARLRARVRERYSAEVVIPQWESLLDEITARLPEPHRMYIQSMDRGLDFPAEIQIQTTTYCNAACVMCPYPEVSKEFPRGKMEDELYDQILDECGGEPGLRRIEPFLMNESFTDKRIVDLIARAKQKVPHAMVTVTTNGAPLIPRVTDRLIHSGLDAIWFSFNGVTPETYEKIMGISYDRVKSNIDYLLDVRPESLQVFVNMIETEPMAPEIEENIRYWATRGVQAGSSQLVNRAGNVKNFDDLNYLPISDRPIRTCELPFYKMYILYNGDAVLCCMDWRRNVVVGNVREEGIRGLWNGARYREIRRLHTEGRDGEIDLCAKCSYTLR